MRWATLRVSLLLLLVDALLLAGLFVVAYGVRAAATPWIGRSISEEAVLSVARVGFPLTLLTLAFYRLYPGYGLTGVKELERTATAVIVVFFFLASVMYLNKPLQQLPRSILVLVWGMAVGVLPLGRFGLRRYLARFSWYGVPVVVYGQAPWAQEAARMVRAIPRLGWRVQQVRTGPLTALEAQVATDSRRHAVALVALAPEQNPAPYARVLARHFHRVVWVQSYPLFGSLWVEPRDLAGKLGLEFHYHLLRRANRWLKRGLDVVGAGLLLLLLAPFLLVVAVLIRLDSRGPIFYRQPRLGLHGRVFQVLKFRTMVEDAEQRLHAILAHDAHARHQYARYHKLEHDPRVTRVGRWLRKYSLDELPQLWNVLRGEMSLVGPRAYMPSERAEMGRYAAIILSVRPGMTGWWQVQGRHRTPFQRRLALDEYYISNWSLWMDIFIVLKTVWVVLTGQGR